MHTCSTYSQQRGPTCARYFAQKLQDLEEDDSMNRASAASSDKYLTVHVLRSGFEGWRRRFRDRGQRFIQDD